MHACLPQYSLIPKLSAMIKLLNLRYHYDFPESKSYLCIYKVFLPKLYLTSILILTSSKFINTTIYIIITFFIF